MIINKRYTWKHLFQTAITDIHDWNESLTDKTLWNPTSDVVCALLWIYSMETFVYSSLNAATRDHDPAYVNTLGPLAQALGYIVFRAESKRPKDSSSLPGNKFSDLYRGISLPDSVVQ